MLKKINDKKVILKIVSAYFILGFAWVFLSDAALGWIIHDAKVNSFINTYKGILFIVATSIFLYSILAKFIGKINLVIRDHIESDEIFHFLVKNTSDILVIVDSEGRQRYVSQAAEKMTGFSPAELKDKSIYDVIHPEDIEDVKAIWKKSLNHPEKSFAVKYRHIHKTREWIYCEAIAQNFLNESGVNGVIASVRDTTENTLTLQTLAEKDALLHAILRNMPFDFWARNMDEKIIMQNDESIKLWGDLTSAEYNNSGLNQKTIKRWESNNRRAFGGQQISEECELITKDNEKRLYHNIVVPILDKDRMLGILGINIDITDRKIAELTLRESEQRFLHAFEYAAIGMALVSPNGQFMKVNNALSKLLGFTENELLSKTLQEITHPEDQDIGITYDRKMLKGDIAAYQVEKRFLHQDGRVIWALLSVSSDRNPEGRINHFVTQIVDISSRKKAEEELRKGENMMKKIFDILPIALWILDKDGLVRHQNAMGSKLWATDPDAPFIGPIKIKAWRLPSQIPIEEEDRASVKAFRKGITTVDELIEIEALDGTRKTVLNYATPMFDDEGNIDGAIIVNLDISDRKKLEEQLLMAQKMESVGRLAGGVAHDFNNMLSVILGNVELAMHILPPDDAVMERLNGVKDAAKRSANLTQQLLAFARKQPVSPKLLDLNKTVEEMLEMLRRLIGEDIELAWLPGKSLGSVNIDPSQIDQLLVNLCVNARDAIGNTGKIIIATDTQEFKRTHRTSYSSIPPGNYITLTVSDNGKGIDDSLLANIFEPFFTTKELGKGTGLGLATVYGIVTQNNGHIDVSSMPGQLTVFKIYLPAHSTPSRPADDHIQIDKLARGHETIFLVEDEPMLIDMTREMLNRLGYTVHTCTSPAWAIRMIQENQGKIDLLITDVIMPEMNGRDLARAVSSLYPDLKVLFTSGYTADVIAHHGVLDKGFHFLQKPITSKDLSVKVREALESEVTFCEAD